MHLWSIPFSKGAAFIRLERMAHPHTNKPKLAHGPASNTTTEVPIVIEGRLAIQFEGGSLELEPGQLLTTPQGVRHRTRPVGPRTVSLTFQLAQLETVRV